TLIQFIELEQQSGRPIRTSRLRRLAPNDLSCNQCKRHPRARAIHGSFLAPGMSRQPAATPLHASDIAQFAPGADCKLLMSGPRCSGKQMISTDSVAPPAACRLNLQANRLLDVLCLE